MQTSEKKKNYIASVPVQEILPVIDANYESSVEGIYVIGDATGIPLVKIAANQGRQAVERMAAKKEMAPDPSLKFLDLVIIGGGPAGLSAAIEARKKGWSYVVLERAKAASTVRSFPPGKKVYAEPRSIPNESELECDSDLEKEEFLTMIDEQIRNHQLHIKEQTEVTKIRKTGEQLFEVDTKTEKTFACSRVIIAIGRQGQPRLLDVPGAERSDKVTYRFHTAEDYRGRDVLVVGGGNSAIEAALMLSNTSRVTISYRGTDFFRAKENNRKQMEQAVSEGKIRVFFDSNVREIRDREVVLEVGGSSETITNDQVVIQIGTLPPIDFLLDSGLEMDGIWTPRRFAWAFIGICVGLFIYFVARNFVLLEEKAASGYWHLPGLAEYSPWLKSVGRLVTYLLPIPWLLLLGLVAINQSLRFKNRRPLLTVPGSGFLLLTTALLYYFAQVAPRIFTFNAEQAGNGPYYLPGFAWLFSFVPEYFAGLGGLYYLLYFSAIAVFGIYWAVRINHPLLWRRNLTIITVQWTIWWGIPTFLVVLVGTNPWTPLLSRLVNAWPLKMDAFDIDPSIVRPGDPAWWYIVGVVGVVWAVFLTFVAIPLFTIRYGKIYCSYICSCGALAETVGNSFRHRGPKGDGPRKLEKYGYLFVLLATVATIGSMLGFAFPLQLYNVWVGTFLAGALAVGLYPFLGQRIWCRMWCPLAFWMNFWGRWSKFRISAEKGKCIDCNMCNQYCQMGIDIKSRALMGEPVTLVDTPCVGCAECVIRCPMEILHIGEIPETKLHQIGIADSSPVGS
ncbi:MAG: NAD(P)-binding domain-containing protein [Planctomycetota bacterium]|nr:NAD(P)-binding domain-containing protein [Planctomycetota bacterium]